MRSPVQKFRIRFSTITLLWACLPISVVLALFYSNVNYTLQRSAVPCCEPKQEVTIFDASRFEMTAVNDLPIVVRRAIVISDTQISDAKSVTTVRVRLIDKFSLWFAGPDLCVDRTNGESDRFWVNVDP